VKKGKKHEKRAIEKEKTVVFGVKE